MAVRINELNLLIPSPQHVVWIESINRNIIFKRDDLIHPIISGNKYRKLKYILEDFFISGKKSIAVIGGAHSNLLHAVSFLCKEFNVENSLFVYGSVITSDNEMIADCIRWGSIIELVSRTQKQELIIRLKLSDQIYFIEEGAASELAERGVGDLMDELIGFEDKDKTAILVSYGTGATVRGLLQYTEQCHFIASTPVQQLTLSNNPRLFFLEPKYKLSFAGYHQDYHQELINFEQQYGISMDPIYTGKLLLNFLHNYRQYEHYDQIIFIHTGGLQAWRAYKHRWRC